MAEDRVETSATDAPADRFGDALRAAARAMPRECTFSASDWQILSGYWHPVAYSGEVTDQPVQACALLIENCEHLVPLAFFE